MSGGLEAAERAQALVGVRFRPQGRSAEQGLDCIGLAAAAAGVDLASVPRSYRLRSGSEDQLVRELPRLGFVRVAEGEAAPGDVAVVRPGPAALHLAILTPEGFVHADIQLRRVAAVPGPLPWPILSVWRKREA